MPGFTGEFSADFSGSLEKCFDAQSQSDNKVMGARAGVYQGFVASEDALRNAAALLLLKNLLRRVHVPWSQLLFSGLISCSSTEVDKQNFFQGFQRFAAELPDGARATWTDASFWDENFFSNMLQSAVIPREQGDLIAACRLAGPSKYTDAAALEVLRRDDSSGMALLWPEAWSADYSSTIAARFSTCGSVVYDREITVTAKCLGRLKRFVRWLQRHFDTASLSEARLHLLSSIAETDASLGKTFGVLSHTHAYEPTRVRVILIQHAHHEALALLHDALLHSHHGQAGDVFAPRTESGRDCIVGLARLVLVSNGLHWLRSVVPGTPHSCA